MTTAKTLSFPNPNQVDFVPLSNQITILALTQHNLVKKEKVKLQDIYGLHKSVLPTFILVIGLFLTLLSKTQINSIWQSAEITILLNLSKMPM